MERDGRSDQRNDLGGSTGLNEVCMDQADGIELNGWTEMAELAGLNKLDGWNGLDMMENAVQKRRIE